jgi:hypothetical protein
MILAILQDSGIKENYSLSFFYEKLLRFLRKLNDGTLVREEIF